MLQSDFLLRAITQILQPWPDKLEAESENIKGGGDPFSMASSVLYSIVQFSTVQYSKVQYSTIPYSTVQYSALQCSTVQ